MKFKISMERVRVDFGDGNFSDVNIENPLLFEAPTLNELKDLLKEFLKERDGQFIEINDNNLVFDTKDLTIYAVVTEDGEDVDLDTLSALFEDLK